MKNIYFLLFAFLISTTAIGQKTATALAAAEIVSPIDIATVQDLDFGKVANSTAGTVTINTDNTIAGTLSQVGNTSPQVAIFEVTAANDFSYTITLPESLVLANGTHQMTVDSFTHDAGVTPTGTGSAQTVSVGATLNVSANQGTGVYDGSFAVTVAYE